MFFKPPTFDLVLGEVVVSFGVGGVVHEEDKEISGHVNDSLIGELELDALEFGDVCDFDFVSFERFFAIEA